MMLFRNEFKQRIRNSKSEKNLIFKEKTSVASTTSIKSNHITSFMKVEYNNLYTHFVFTTLNRLPLIVNEHRERIEKYITGIVKNNESHLYAIYANPEHVHFLISRSPKISEESIATIVANSSERFINENKFCQGKFKWQDTCSAFSVSKGDVGKVCNYILNQLEHHRKVSFMEEYDAFIKFYQKTIDPNKK